LAQKDPNWRAKSSIRRIDSSSSRSGQKTLSNQNETQIEGTALWAAKRTSLPEEEAKCETKSRLKFLNIWIPGHLQHPIKRRRKAKPTMTSSSFFKAERATQAIQGLKSHSTTQ
jgi:hypothetical protein